MAKTPETTALSGPDCNIGNPRFVFPLSAPALLTHPTDLSSMARVLKRCPRDLRIPPSLAGTGLVTDGERPASTDLAIDRPTHLRISCILQEIENVVVVAPGIGFEGENVVFDIHFSSPITTSSNSGYVVDVPAPENAMTYAGTELIFDGIVAHGCGNTDVVPLSINAEIFAFDGETTGFAPFDATDDTTLKPNGYWSFNFVIRASTINGGGVSDFRVRGIVSIVCTNVGSV